jgi:hypothetical protein
MFMTSCCEHIGPASPDDEPLPLPDELPELLPELPDELPLEPPSPLVLEEQAQTATTDVSTAPKRITLRITTPPRWCAVSSHPTARRLSFPSQ